MFHVEQVWFAAGPAGAFVQSIRKRIRGSRASAGNWIRPVINIRRRDRETASGEPRGF